MSDHVTDNVRNTDDHQKFRVDETWNDEQRSSVTIQTN